MSSLTPLDTLFDLASGSDLPLPPEIRSLYGRLRLPAANDRPTVIGNFVTTLDGVVSLGVPGHAGGADISGANLHDRMVMGILRAAVDAVIVGAGTLGSVPDHLWTAQYIYPPLAPIYEQMRASLGKRGPPLNVIVSGQGDVDSGQRVFRSGEVPVLIVTTRGGFETLQGRGLPASVQVVAVTSDESISPDAILQAVGRARPTAAVLVEGGPHLIGDFFAADRLDDLFLTLAPQVAGRDHSSDRPGLVAGRTFAPEHPLWGKLVGVKRASSHLFLRYSF